jgi:hypothetical protein
MRIKREDVIYENVTLKEKGNTIVGGHVIAQHGKLEANPLCEDITEYRTEIGEDGNKIQVEVIPEPIEVDIG